MSCCDGDSPKKPPTPENLVPVLKDMDRLLPGFLEEMAEKSISFVIARGGPPTPNCQVPPPGSAPEVVACYDTACWIMQGGWSACSDDACRKSWLTWYNNEVGTCDPV